MGILERLGDLFDIFLNQIINIPLNNTLSIIYVILNLLTQIFALFSYGVDTQT